MAKLRAMTAKYARELGFPVGSIVKFTEAAKADEPWYRDKEFIVTGAIRGYGRIELDTWPRTSTYTAVEAELLVLVRAASLCCAGCGRPCQLDRGVELPFCEEHMRDEDLLRAWEEIT